MAKLDLIMPKTVFVAGDEVNGTIILTCDKKTECKSFRTVIKGVLTAKGEEITTRKTYKGRVLRKIDTRSYVIHREEIMFAQETAFDPGTQKFKFRFKLPEDAKVTYEGHNGNIRYAVLALMDVSKKAKLKTSKPIRILQTDYDFAEKVMNAVAEHEGEEILKLEIDSQKYCIGSDFTFRYRVNTDMKFNRLRARIEHIEASMPKGKITIVYTEVLWDEQILSEDVIHNEWNEWTFNINKTCPPWLLYENLQSALNLKLTIVRSFRFDKSAEIALIPVHCNGTLKSIEREAEVVDIVVPKEKPRPTRLKCNICSYSFKLKDDDVDFGTCPSCGRQIYF